MMRNHPFRILLVLVVIAAVAGCRAKRRTASTPTVIQPVVSPDTYIESASADFASDSLSTGHIAAAAPMTSRTQLPEEMWPMSLNEAIEIALNDTEILRSLGARVVNNPEQAVSTLDPAIQLTDPNFGVDAALSEFDGRFNSRLNFAKNDDVFNNPVLGGGATEIRDDVSTGSINWSRTSLRGTRFSINGEVLHSQNTSPTPLLFPTSWRSLFEVTARHPLLQGRGLRFNEIAGPVVQPGIQLTTGVVVSRIDNDISIAQFRRNLRDMISEVIQAYWELEVANRNFQSIRDIRDAGRETWQITKARYDNELRGGEADREAQALEQLYQFESRLLTALNGDQQSGQIGILQAEANLRRLLNLPQSDDRLIVPSDDPAEVETVFNWPDLAGLALNCRIELWEQKRRIAQRELELEAARNFTLPRLDAVATYRNNGFGDDLAFGGPGRFSSALKDAFSGDHNEWELGLVYDVPIGFRQAHAGVKNAELLLSRERAILKEQESQILHDLGSSLRQVEQSYDNIKLNTKRLQAARNAVAARNAAYDADNVGFDELLIAQQRLLDSQLTYYQSQLNYEIAKVQLLTESGQLLQENRVRLANEQCLNCR